MSQIDFCANGKWSVRKPPPFFLEKKPLKPHRLSGRAPTSSRSTTSRSPGSAPSTPIGPDRKCTMVRSMSRTSSADFVVLDEAAGPVVGLDDEVIARLDPLDDRNVRMPPVVDHVVLVGGFRKVDLHNRLGHCRLLARTLVDFTHPTPARGIDSHREEAGDRRFIDVIAGVGMHDAAALHDQDAVGDIEHEAQHLLADHDADDRECCGCPAAAAPGP